MTAFTTRPEILGTFGVVTSTHWIASAVGMSILEKGGNAFDAAVATGFTLQILEPHLVGPGGDMPAIIYSKKKDKVEVICAQGPAPAGATIEHYTSEGLKLIPGDGLLATVIPGSFDGWMLMLRDYGRMSVRDVLEPAIYYAENGHPLLPRVSATIKGLAEFFEKEWPTSYDTWVPGGSVPEPNSNFKNPVLAETWKRIISEAEAKQNREAQIEAARDAFYRGFVAEKIADYLKNAEVMDASGSRHKAVLTADDMANWSATIEEPQTYDYHGWTVAKIGPWGQGPVFLQTLSILKGMDIAAMAPDGADFVHTVTEAMKLAFADREVYYGDPKFGEVPLDQLLSDTYAAVRRKLITNEASFDLRPGKLAGFEQQYDVTMEMLGADSKTGAVYEPTMAHLTEKRGDTVHIDVIDREGNMVSVTPSGGWLQSSPIIPGLGFCLNSRAQMFWLRPGLPTSLTPGKRPRTTLTPSLALYEGRPTLAFGTPGGDQQEQWQLSFFLRYVHHKMNLQAAIDQPLFHTSHFPGSFYPRTREPGGLMVEGNFRIDVLDNLRARGHALTVSEPWTIGRLTAARRDTDGLLRAAATPRLMQAYAIGR
ncbi:gamma-glutamyltranspeptidase/glutathione hydrolase [Rhizobium sp. BK275]|uniref:gamma-glutamyltransferase family protein n=1 Tax=unclassified Rhizobium TaxID=2613769 RepID=UPI0016225829|nr:MULTISPECIES: gamma-glutamyltransferase family protein [unclassified Rhizobium]MBB3391326.1 gamma-glutamyltranspeptidase/glutathione hydrolase [Rhizobium sp. BK275]MBB3411698.1 gamma-glutamyltranspeptidase/glutathione hydrolase [Rhizobium sp. BK316]